MAQMPCESSLRPDWLTVSFRSASEKHRLKVWEFVQQSVERCVEGMDWNTTLASRHFESCFQHELGVRFETSPLDSEHNAGVSVVNYQGQYFGLSSVYEQMRLLEQLLKFKGRYHWTRLDVEITTLNPSQSAEQIVKDVEEKRLWVKGYQGWRPAGLRTFDGSAVNGLSAHFGASSSDRQATSYNKAAEQGWDIEARRDETRLRGPWAETHTDAIATAIAGAASENQAIEAFQRSCGAVIAQHMQYLDITGTPIPKPKDWARGKKAPKWWSETLETTVEPARLNRKPSRDIDERIAHMRMQWSPTWAEACAERYASGRAESVQQASFDLAQAMLSGLRPEHVQRIVDRYPIAEREALMAELMKAANEAAVHDEVS